MVKENISIIVNVVFYFEKGCSLLVEMGVGGVRWVVMKCFGVFDVI